MKLFCLSEGGGYHYHSIVGRCCGPREHSFSRSPACWCGCLMVGISTTWGTVLKAHSIGKAENYCCGPSSRKGLILWGMSHHLGLSRPGVSPLLWYEGENCTDWCADFRGIWVSRVSKCVIPYLIPCWVLQGLALAQEIFQGYTENILHSPAILVVKPYV